MTYVLGVLFVLALYGAILHAIRVRIRRRVLTVLALHAGVLRQRGESDASLRKRVAESFRLPRQGLIGASQARSEERSGPKPRWKYPLR